MRKLIENPVYMPYEKIKEEFYGKWILIANCNYNQYQRLLGGVPVAVADTIYEGHKDGFYDKFDNPEYAPKTYRYFNYDNIPGILAFFDVAEKGSDDIAARA